MPKVRASSGMIGTMRGPSSGSRSSRRKQLHERHRRRDLARAAAQQLGVRLDGRQRRYRHLHAPQRQRPAERLPARAQVLHLGASDTRVEVGRVLVLQLQVGDREVEDVPERLELGDVELLLLVRGVAPLEVLAERPPLHGLDQDGGGPALGLGGELVGGVDLLVVVAAELEVPDLLVREVGDQLLEPRVDPEEVVAHEGAALDVVALPPPVDDGVEARQQHTVLVAPQQLVPLAAQDHLDDVPPGASEHRLQLLDDLAVAPHRPVQALQVAVDHEHQVVEPLRGGHVQRPQGLRLVGLAVAQERPHPRAGRVRRDLGAGGSG